MSKRKKESVLSRVVKAFHEKTRFYLDEDNEQGFKLVAEQITWYLLKDYSEREKLLRFNGLLIQVKNILSAALRYIEDVEGIAVRRDCPKGKKNLRGITLNGYRHSKERDTKRTKRQIRTFVSTKVKHLNLSDPKAIDGTLKLFLPEPEKENNENQAS